VNRDASAELIRRRDIVPASPAQLRAAREPGELLRRTAVKRSALSVFTWVGLRRVDFRDGRSALTSHS